MRAVLINAFGPDAVFEAADVETPELDDTRFSLEEAGQGHVRLESGRAMGKVVVEN